ncbi:MAG: hypothetical protein Q9168_007657 [Polycauliona sp. 1 TL-2023]
MQSDNIQGVIPPPQGVEANFVNPVYHSGGIVPITIIFVTLSTVFLAVRIYTKAHIIKVFGLEDFQQKYGNGIHLWNITVPRFLIYSRWSAAATILYCPSVALAKIAILIFYLRLNPTPSFRYSVFAVLFITTGYMIALCLAIFFQCQPVAKLWNPILEGHCVKVVDLYLWNTILNVSTDFLVLIVPIPMLRKLQVGTRQKWVLASLFGVGSLTCILSAVRTYYIAILLHQPDTSWNVPTSTSLIVAECNLSVICGCLMVLRPFVRRHLPFLLGSETRRGRAGGVGAAIYDGYQRSETTTKISSGKHRKSNTMGSLGGGLRSLVGGGGGGGGGAAGRRATADTDSTFVNGAEGRDIELGKVGWPLESGRDGSGGGGRKARDIRSESEENIIEQAAPVQGGIVKTVKVDVR